VESGHDVEDELLRSFEGREPRVRAVRTPIPMFPTTIRVLRGHGYWRRQLVRDAIDVFHHTYFPLPAGVERVSNVVLTLHDLIQRGMPGAYPTARRWFTNLTQPPALRRANVVAVISDAVREDVRRFHPRLDIRKLEVVPNAVGEPYRRRGEAPRDRAAAARVRERYGLPERYLLGVGHLEPRKTGPGSSRRTRASAATTRRPCRTSSSSGRSTGNSAGSMAQPTTGPSASP
jgi:hypothetical protein